MQSRSEGLFPLSSHQTACEFLLHTTIRLSSILLSTALYHTTIRCKPFFRNPYSAPWIFQTEDGKEKVIAIDGHGSYVTEIVSD